MASPLTESLMGPLVEQAVELIPAYLYVRDASERFVLANELFAVSYFGIPKTSVVGKTPDRLGGSSRTEDEYFGLDLQVMASGITRWHTSRLLSLKQEPARLLQTVKIPLGEGIAARGVLSVSIDPELWSALSGFHRQSGSGSASAGGRFIEPQLLTHLLHELRTPLNAIVGFSEILLEEKVPVSAAEQREFIADIQTAGQRLMKLINQTAEMLRNRGRDGGGA